MWLKKSPRSGFSNFLQKRGAIWTRKCPEKRNVDRPNPAVGKHIVDGDKKRHMYHVRLPKIG